MKPIPFRRELAPEFFQAALERPLSDILRSCKDHEADVRLHGSHIRVYARGNRVIAIRLDGQRRQVCEIHHAYCQPPVALATSPSKCTARDLQFILTHEFAETWIANFPAICAQAERAKRGPEGYWEAKVIQENRSDAPVTILDRQVQIPRSGKGRRLDLLGVSVLKGDDILVAAELKQGNDTRIKDLAEQVERYVKMLSGDGGGLSPQIANSYQVVAAQMTQLGLDAPKPERLRPGMPVVGLIAIAERNQQSQLLSMARQKATTSRLRMYWTDINEAHCRLAPPEEWNTLGDDI